MLHILGTTRPITPDNPDSWPSAGSPHVVVPHRDALAYIAKDRWRGSKPAALWADCIAPGAVSGPSGVSKSYGLVVVAADTIPTMRQLPERCASCGRQIAALETCVLPDDSQKRGAEVTFRESVEGGIRCTECASQHSPEP
jgi:hypothetical protein